MQAVFKILPGEGRTVLLVVALMLCAQAGSSIGSSSIQALFFARLGVQLLPALYVVLGFITILLTLGVAALLSRFAATRVHAALPLVLAEILVAARLLLLIDADWLYPVLWVFASVMVSAQGVFTWGLAGAACDTRQAKRLFPLVNAGGILGAVAGGLATAPLAIQLGAGESQACRVRVPAGPTRTPEEDVRRWRVFLSQRLPEYMIPSSFVTLPALPLTPNGKIDRDALPPPARAAGSAERHYHSPRSSVERIRADIWEEVLGVEPIGVHDNIFELGGYSPKAIRVMSRVRDAFGIELPPLNGLLAAPTVAHLAEPVAMCQLEQADSETLSALLKELEPQALND